MIIINGFVTIVFTTWHQFVFKVTMATILANGIYVRESLPVFGLRNLAAICVVIDQLYITELFIYEIIELMLLNLFVLKQNFDAD